MPDLVTRKEFYERIDAVEQRIIERIDNLEEEIANQHCRDIDRIERRLSSQDSATRIGALIGTIIATVIGFVGWSK